MGLDNYNENELQLEQQRRRRAEQFRLNIESGKNEPSFDYDSEINSYSGEDVKEQLERNSRKALKKMKKSEKKKRKAKDKHNRRVFNLIWLVSVVIVGVMAAMFIITGMNDMLAINRTDMGTVQVDIPENPTLETVTAALVHKGVINQPSYFKLYAHLTKADDDFTQGTYEMRKNMDYEAIVNYLLSSSNRTDTVSVTILEGQNVLEIASTLEEGGALNDRDGFLQLLNSDDFDEDFDFLAAITNNDERYYKLEGYLYPDTYEFYENEDPTAIIYKFLNNYEQKINEKQEVEGYSKKTTVLKMAEEQKSEYSFDEIMVIASIIQAEAADVDDMYVISSILHNRLESGADVGVATLGLDSTQFYPYRTAKDVPSGEGANYVSKYDTYEKAGLPAGAICNPGMDAILAALNPSSTGYYFFCHDSQGTAYYASTLYEQEANLEYIESYDN